MEKNTNQDKKSWLDTTALSNINISWELIIFGIIILLAVVTRFYDLGARVISHDETSHVYYSWRLFKGMGYSHDPITHGPFQFHFLALIYFLLGCPNPGRAHQCGNNSVPLEIPPLSRKLGNPRCRLDVPDFSLHALLRAICPERIFYCFIWRGDTLGNPALPGNQLPEIFILAYSSYSTPFHHQRNRLHLYCTGNDLLRVGFHI